MTELTKDENVIWHQHQVTKQTRAELKNQNQSFCGLPGYREQEINRSGALESKLAQLGYHTYLLDGDNVRHGLCRDLGFSAQDRRENIRRIGELAKLMADAGLIVLSAFISPHRAERQMVRELLPEGEFIEVLLMRLLLSVSSEILRGCIRKPVPGKSLILPALILITKRRNSQK